MTKIYTLKKAEDIFEKLKERKEEEIICLFWWYTGAEIRKVILKEVFDFEFIETEEVILHFVGNPVAIITILSKEGQILYYNPYVVREYNGNSDKLRDEINRKMFGNEVADDKLELAQKQVIENEKILAKFNYFFK